MVTFNARAFLRRHPVTGSEIPTGLIPGATKCLKFLLNPVNYTLIQPSGGLAIGGGEVVLGNSGKKPGKKLEVKMVLNITSPEMKTSFFSYLPEAGINPFYVATRGVSVCEDFFKYCVKQDANEQNHQPDLVSFHWGCCQEASFLGNLSYKGSFTKFDRLGVPVEGTYSITIDEFTGALPGDSKLSSAYSFLPFASPDRSKCEIIRSGTTLWDIARQEYEDEDEWKRIAMSNKISDPLDIEPGKIVKIPAMI